MSYIDNNDIFSSSVAESLWTLTIISCNSSSCAEIASLSSMAISVSASVTDISKIFFCSWYSCCSLTDIYYILQDEEIESIDIVVVRLWSTYPTSSDGYLKLKKWFDKI